MTTAVVSTDVIHLASQLIACPSVTPNDAGCQKIIRNRLEQIGFICESFKIGEVDNLWARFGNSSPLLVLAGHTDVVPTGPESDWFSNPFNPDIRGGFLYGRGASDMKSALAAMIIASEHFLKETTHFSGSIAFLITSDEEGPGQNGTKKVIEILQKRNIKIDYCLIGEPSSEHEVGDQIRIGRRGSLHGKLVIHGKQGHVAHPHLADNPIHKAMLALHELSQQEWDKGNEHFPATTFQITNIHSGTGASNLIPGHLEVVFNLRFATASTKEQLQEKITHILTRHHLTFDLEWHIGGLPFLTQPGRLIKSTQDAITQLLHRDVRLSTGGGTSDGRFIAPTGAEVVELGISHATAHQVNECVKIEDVEKLVVLYQQIFKNLF